MHFCTHTHTHTHNDILKRQLPPLLYTITAVLQSLQYFATHNHRSTDFSEFPSISSTNFCKIEYSRKTNGLPVRYHHRVDYLFVHSWVMSHVWTMMRPTRWWYGVATVSKIDKMIVSFAEYCLFYMVFLQRRFIILSILLTKATPYLTLQSTPWWYILPCTLQSTRWW